MANLQELYSSVDRLITFGKVMGLFDPAVLDDFSAIVQNYYHQDLPDSMETRQNLYILLKKFFMEEIEKKVDNGPIPPEYEKFMSILDEVFVTEEDDEEQFRSEQKDLKSRIKMNLSQEAQGVIDANDEELNEIIEKLKKRSLSREEGVNLFRMRNIGSRTRG